MNDSERIAAFLEEGPFAVAGASTDRSKYGNKVLRCYQQNERGPLYALNPRADEVEGVPSFGDLGDVPEKVRSLSIITPPAITEDLVERASYLGVEHVWMQPGAESDAAIARATELGMNVIAGGPCLLVVLGYSE